MTIENNKHLNGHEWNILNNNKRRNYEFEDSHTHGHEKKLSKLKSKSNRIRHVTLQTYAHIRNSSVLVGSESAHGYEWTDSIVLHRSKLFFNNRHHQISSIDNGFLCLPRMLHAACIYVHLCSLFHSFLFYLYTNAYVPFEHPR